MASSARDAVCIRFRDHRHGGKAEAGMAPSNLFINGRYILQPEIFAILETQERGAGNEIQLTDAMLGLAKEQEFSGYRLGGTFDCGSKEGFIQANVAFAL